jgi:hypothetical protein
MTESLRARTRRLGLVKVGSSYTTTDVYGRNIVIKRATPTKWKAMTRFDRGWTIVAVENTLDEIVAALAVDVYNT